MSQVKITGNASGTGVLTIAAPNTSTDRTLSLPDNTGSIITTASTVTPKVPLLVAYKDSAAQSIPTNTFTKVTFDAEEIDTDGWFASSTYTPQQAGYYHVTCGLYWQFLQSDIGLVNLYKNGSLAVRLQRETVNSNNNDTEVSGDAIVHCNGSTDYLEIYAYQDAGSNKDIWNGGSNSGRPYTRLEIFLVRAD